LSFLYGNYITLTSMGKRGIRRILEQRLSPLYVSVHATDIDVRTRMLGIKRRIDVLALLRELTRGGITVHTQIVLCPGWNDGEILERTLDDLGGLFPGVASIAVVPVGLSDHREGLTDLRPVTPEDAARAIDQVTAWGDRFLAVQGDRLAFVSDEFFLKARRPFPDLAFYESLPQEDNGIGQARSLLEEVRTALPLLGEAGEGHRRATLVTGTLAASFFTEQVLPLLQGLDWLDLRVVGVENTLYGPGITVAGLLPGRDFVRALAALPSEAGTVLLPSTPINHEGVFLDDLPLEQLVRESSHPVIVCGEGLVEALLQLASS
jgi:putative radical SAM enzyme (TIGR03279 family)